MPDSVTEIDEEAFMNCPNLENIVFSTNLSTIGARAFKGCGFKKLVLSNSLKKIEEAFASNKNLKFITLPEKL